MALNKMSLANSSRMTKIWLLGGTAGCVLLAALAWFIVVSPALSRVSTVKSQVAAADSKNDLLRIKLAQLQSEKAGIATLRTSLTNALEGLPINSGMADFTAQLQAQAVTAQVRLGSIGAGTPSVVAAASGSTATTTPPAATSPGSTAAPGSLYSIPVTITADGDLTHLDTFLKLVQTQGPRRALVVSTQFAPVSGSTQASIDTAVQMTVQLQVFTSPQTPAQQAQLAKLLGLNSGQ